jgi:hypothetical protein
MKRLSEAEINKVLEKIKNKYEEYAGQYGKEVFPYEQFRRRYLDYLRSGSSLDVFLFAEIQALEDKKKDIEERRAKRKRVAAAKEYLDQKEEELYLKIASYPEEDIHSKARLEIRKLVAVLNALYENLTHHHYDIPRDFNRAYRDCLNAIKDVTVKPYSGLIAKYIRELDDPFVSPSRLEITEQALIKEWGIALNTFISIFQRIKGNREIEEFLELLTKISRDFRLQIFRPVV